MIVNSTVLLLPDILFKTPTYVRKAAEPIPYICLCPYFRHPRRHYFEAIGTSQETPAKLQHCNATINDGLSECYWVRVSEEKWNGTASRPFKRFAEVKASK